MIYAVIALWILGMASIVMANWDIWEGEVPQLFLVEKICLLLVFLFWPISTTLMLVAIVLGFCCDIWFDLRNKNGQS
jgi:hypothetical protein